MPYEIPYPERVRSHVRTARRRGDRRLVILDDVFPHPLSAFRTAEYEAYLGAFDTKVFSDGRALGALGDLRGIDAVIDEYARANPRFAARVSAWTSETQLEGDLAVFMFVNNAAVFLDPVERAGIPFVFTLYPGGGFHLDEPRSDDILRRTLASKLLHKVIVTQPVARDYVLDKGMVDPAKVSFIRGGVHPVPHTRRRLVYGRSKSTIDICFVGFRYMPGGADKGYDLFVSAARRIAAAQPDVRFHVVGTFDETDADTAALGSRVTFHGTLRTDEFPKFYASMDALVTPNRPFLLRPGAFDGFPLGAEACMHGVALFCTDPLDQNIRFVDGRDLVIIPPESEAVADILCSWIDRYDRLRALGRRGQRAFRRSYGFREQVRPRFEIIEEGFRSLAAGVRRP